VALPPPTKHERYAILVNLANLAYLVDLANLVNLPCVGARLPFPQSAAFE
jgi:hypothetical protein